MKPVLPQKSDVSNGINRSKHCQTHQPTPRGNRMLCLIGADYSDCGRSVFTSDVSGGGATRHGPEQNTGGGEAEPCGQRIPDVMKETSGGDAHQHHGGGGGGGPQNRAKQGEDSHCGGGIEVDKNGGLPRIAQWGCDVSEGKLRKCTHV